MSEFFFTLAFIWIIASVGSVILGPFVGFDRRRIKIDIADFYRKIPKSAAKRLPLIVLLAFSYVGFLIPTLYPVLGFIFGCIFILFI